MRCSYPAGHRFFKGSHLAHTYTHMQAGYAPQDLAGRDLAMGARGGDGPAGGGAADGA